MSSANIKNDSRLFRWLLAIIGVSFILPEYIAPLFVFFFYIPFLKHFKKTGRNAKIVKIFDETDFLDAEDE